MKKTMLLAGLVVALLAVRYAGDQSGGRLDEWATAAAMSRFPESPTLVLIDASGRIRHQHFGQVSDLVLGAQVASLVHEAEATTRPLPPALPTEQAFACDADGCHVEPLRV